MHRAPALLTGDQRHPPALTLGSRGRKTGSVPWPESLLLGLYVLLRSTAAAERC